MKWKTLAIILLVILIIENLILGIGWYQLNQEEKKTNLCYYTICQEYPEAYYLNGVCTCYELDLMGEYIVGYQQYLK